MSILITFCLLFVCYYAQCWSKRTAVVHWENISWIKAASFIGTCKLIEPKSDTQFRTINHLKFQNFQYWYCGFNLQWMDENINCGMDLDIYRFLQPPFCHRRFALRGFQLFLFCVQKLHLMMHSVLFAPTHRKMLPCILIININWKIWRLCRQT